MITERKKSYKSLTGFRKSAMTMLINVRSLTIQKIKSYKEDQMNTELAVAKGISVTLNGGKKEMNSATIPIEWWLSEEVIKKNPKYILIFEQNKREKDDVRGNTNRGRRHVFNASDAVAFMPVFSAGYHRVMVVVVSDERSSAKETANLYLRENEHEVDQYYSHMDWEDAKDNACDKRDDAFIASTVVEFEVPADLFAEKPRSKAGQLMWNWVNRWHTRGPRDECDYRSRMMIAFTVQPPLVILWCLLKNGIVGTVYALGILILSFLTFLCGFRPRPLLREMWRAFTFTRVREWDVTRYGGATEIEGGWQSTCRVWSLTKTTNDKGKIVHTAIYMPVVPLVVVLAGGACFGLYSLVMKLVGGELQWFFPLMIGGTIFVLTTLFFVKIFPLFWKVVSGGIHKLDERIGDWATEQKKEEKAVMQKWMLENITVAKQTDSVRLDQLPIPPDLKGRLVQRFRVGYWALKVKVCKPFAH